MILTVDVGIKNLSMCCMTCGNPEDLKTYEIHLWNTWNTLEMDDHFCESQQKNGKICGKRCNFKYIRENGENVYCCKVHYPKGMALTERNKYHKKKVDQYLLQDITRIVLTKMNEIWRENSELLQQVKGVLIELQPKVNPKMKMISHVLYGKFVELYWDTKTTIRFIRASTKLRAYTGPPIECKLRGAYAKRKWLSVQYVKWIIENKFNSEQNEKWLQMFINTQKRDDLSDVVCYAINALAGNNTRTRDKKGKCIK